MPPKQKDKEILFFLTNVGVHPETGDDFLEKAKEVMSLVITKKIFMRPIDEVGIVLAGRTGIDGVGDGLLELFQENNVPSWDLVEKISRLSQSDVRFDDWHTALTYTLARMPDNQASRTVLIMLFDCDDTYEPPAHLSAQDVTGTLIDQRINVLWIGSKDLSNVSMRKLNASERMIMSILDTGVGEYKKIDEVLPQLRFFKKPNSTYMAWKCLLELGNILIPIVMYVSTTDDVKKPSFKNITVKSTTDNKVDATRGRPDDPDNFVPVRSERDYVDKHKDAQRLCDTIPGYMYGRHFVPLPDVDKQGMNYDGGPKSLKIFGFVPRESIRLEDLSGDSTKVVLGQGLAKPFYCLAQAMANRKRVAIVRRIYAATHNPKMGVLIPRLDVPGEPSCLLFIELSFAEDRRIIQFHSLDSAITNLSKEKEDIVGDMIDAMMLTDHTDADGNELFASGTVRSPNLQHLWNSLSFRALHPDGPEPPMSEHLLKLIEPPESIKIQQEPLLNRLQELFPIEDELALSKKTSETSDKIAVPVLSEVTKMECDLDKLKSDIREIGNDGAEKGLKRKHSFEEIAPPPKESYDDPDLDDLFDADMSL